MRGVGQLFFLFLVKGLIPSYKDGTYLYSLPTGTPHRHDKRVDIVRRLGRPRPIAEMRNLTARLVNHQVRAGAQVQFLLCDRAIVVAPLYCPVVGIERGVIPRAPGVSREGVPPPRPAANRTIRTACELLVMQDRMHDFTLRAVRHPDERVLRRRVGQEGEVGLRLRDEASLADARVGPWIARRQRVRHLMPSVAVYRIRPGTVYRIETNCSQS